MVVAWAPVRFGREDGTWKTAKDGHSVPNAMGIRV